MTCATRESGKPKSYTSGFMSASQKLDAWVREVVDWHFDPATGTPFWLDFARSAAGIRAARSRLRRPAALRRVPGRVAARRPVQRWIPKGLAGKPVFVFETGGTTGIPKTRIASRTSGSTTSCSATRCRRVFPEGRQLADARAVGPRRLRLSVEHLAQYPRRHLLLRRSRSALGHQADQEGLERAPAGLQGSRDRPGGDDPQAGHDIRCMFTTPKLLESLALRLEVDGHDDPQMGITGIFSAAPSSRRSGTASRTRSCSTAPT
jgi:hypothetical protein